jgi:predicted DCC family thiol-disulfide oxidoreductase YuxK
VTITDADRGPILFFDGVCNFCSASVQFVIERERSPTLRFASLQSETAARLLPPLGVDPTALESLVLLQDGQATVRSTAALLTARHLKAPWSWLAVCLLVPRVLRDFVYGIIARNRYRLFGKKDACWLPSQALKARFLES